MASADKAMPSTELSFRLLLRTFHIRISTFIRNSSVRVSLLISTFSMCDRVYSKAVRVRFHGAHRFGFHGYGLRIVTQPLKINEYSYLKVIHTHNITKLKSCYFPLFTNHTTTLVFKKQINLRK